jgi:hypothetical protein
MKLFDYIFYRITEFYSTISNDMSDLIIGPALITLVQILNILSLLLYLSLFNSNISLLFDKVHFKNTKTIFLIPLTILFAYNIYRYSKIKYFDKLKKRWGWDDSRTRQWKTWIVIVYVVMSLILFIYSIVLRTHNNL